MFFKKLLKQEVKKNMENSIEGYEEQEQKTPKAGYLLLIFMFVAATFFGWRAIDDLRDVPSHPEPLSHCAGFFISADWENLGRFNYLNYPVYEESYPLKSQTREPNYATEPPCSYSSLENKSDIPAVMEKRRITLRLYQDTDIHILRIYQDLSEFEKAYDLALLEKIANVGGKIYSISEIQQKLEEVRRNRLELETNQDRLNAELKVYDDKLKSLYHELMKNYRYQWRWYEFKVFLLEIMFVLPFFYLAWMGYRKLLSKNSPYTIILTALIGVASLLLLRVLMVWFWSLFLARIIQTLWNFIQNFALLKSLVFYGGMFLSIAVFGGAVYILQKRIFDPKRVALRRLRQKQCPNCQTSLDLAEDFCPNCGRRLKEKCPRCDNNKWADLPTCGYCGIKKN